MLSIMLPATDDFDAVELQLEHSLVSLSKWEAIHEKPFYGRESQTEDETISYIQQMVIGTAPFGDWVKRLSREDYEAVNAYINSKQSATWFRPDQNAKGPREVVTAELIYFWMIDFGIWKDCENWHVNRLMTLIKISGIKRTKPKRMSRQAQAEEYRRLNEQRRQQYGTSG